MKGFVRRYLELVLRALPFAIAFLRDRRRFLILGGPRRVPESVHRERAERMTAVMLDLGPAFVKAGQVLSTRPDLIPPIYTEAFVRLQDEVPESIGGDPRSVLDAELADEIDLDELEPIAGGSLAFVYAAEQDGDTLALKVRRPGVRQIVERDLAVLRAILPIIGWFADEHQRYSLENVADDFETIILDELDFNREAALMADIRENLAGVDNVIVPAVHEPLSSERILAMEYVPAAKITDQAAVDRFEEDATELASHIARVYLRMGLLDGTFHADPHPGNLGVTAAGDLVIYDFGMSDRLDESVQADITTLYRSLVKRDIDGMLRTLIALEVLDPSVDRVAVRRVLELVIENLEGRQEVTWREIITELFGMLHDFPFRIPPDVMLLVRVGTVGEGVCRELDPSFNFITEIRTFLIEHGFVERELTAMRREAIEALRESAPAMTRVPSRLDRVLAQLDRGELVVRTQPADDPSAVGESIGYAVLAGAAFIAGAILAHHDQPMEIVAVALAVLFLIAFLRARITERRR